ncbi:MAG: hypothetical protein JWQ02_1057, partial [Capsulimonas sp.]|nr:hypothetical protein [Capsulimonas sp.]
MKLALPRLSGRSLAPYLATLALAATASPSLAADFSFHQADWLSDFTGFTSQNSDWGR